MGGGLDIHGIVNNGTTFTFIDGGGCGDEDIKMFFASAATAPKIFLEGIASEWRITDDDNRDAKIRSKNSDKIFNIDFKFRSNDFPFTNVKQAKKYVNYDKYNEFFHIIAGQGNKPYAPENMYVIPLYMFKPFLNSGVGCSFSLDQYGMCKRASPDMDFSIEELHTIRLK